jgi:hypothetical protein
MTRNEIVAAVKRAGYSVVQTATRVISIDEWTPYGCTATDVRMFCICVTGWEFFDGVDARIVDSVPAGQVGGIWPVGPRKLILSESSERLTVSQEGAP